MGKKSKRRAKARATRAATAQATGGPAPSPGPAIASAVAISPEQRNRVIDHLLLGLCAAGVALTTYLSYVAWFGDHPLYCEAGSGCDLVQSSRWSTLLGLPMAFWGLATYALLARLVWRRKTKASAWPAALLVAVCGVAISSYLTAISVIEIGATCAYCLTSYAIITSILVLVVLRKPADAHQFAWGKSLTAPLAAALVIVGGLQMHYSGLFDPAKGPEKPGIQALAQHLADSGAVFYGAYWCPRCQEQKKLFEASVGRIPYAECAPQGPNGPRTAVCAVKEINSYPTWIIGRRRHVGRLSLESLARYSGFAVPDGGF